MGLFKLFKKKKKEVVNPTERTFKDLTIGGPVILLEVSESVHARVGFLEDINTTSTPMQLHAKVPSLSRVVKAEFKNNNWVIVND